MRDLERYLLEWKKSHKTMYTEREFYTDLRAAVKQAERLLEDKDVTDVEMYKLTQLGLK